MAISRLALKWRGRLRWRILAWDRPVEVEAVEDADADADAEGEAPQPDTGEIDTPDVSIAA